MINTSIDLSDYMRPCRFGFTRERFRMHLYALLDVDDNPLYVGRTSRVAERIMQHRYTKPWWPQVADVMALHTCCLDDTSAAELRAIRALTPPHNIDPRDSAIKGHVTRRARQAAA